MIAVEAQRILRALLPPHTREPARRGLVSLLDVLERYSFGFYELILSAQRLRSDVEVYGNSELLLEQQRSEFPAFLAKLTAECDVLGLSYTRSLAVHAESRLVAKGKNYSHKELLSDLDALIFSFGNELTKELFVRIPLAKEPFFQQEALFGSEVAQAFPSSAVDIQHAGTCFALGQDDACVFHLMRVLERGLDLIADKVNVNFDRRNWENIINDIEAALKRMGRGPDVDVHERKLYAEAATQLYFVKDAWRNDVMHAGETYDTGRAQSVLDHVRGFMRALAEAGLVEPSP